MEYLYIIEKKARTVCTTIKKVEKIESDENSKTIEYKDINGLERFFYKNHVFWFNTEEEAINHITHFNYELKKDEKERLEAKHESDLNNLNKKFLDIKIVVEDDFYK